MQHIPATIEEQLFLKSIKDECPWENLPKRLQATLSSKEEWHRRVMEHCIKKRFQWNACFARKVCKEGEYYEEMMRYLRKNLALYPYHLAEYVCRVMRVSPFRYYCDMIFEVMRNEQPYDSIPNFSAADALRLTGIGRNEFIDIMNKCRSKKIMWKLNKSIAKELLPTQPVEFSIEPWWGVCLVNFTLEEFKKLSEDEMATIDKICKEEANSFILFDPDIVRGLHRRGLIYFDVPVYPDDRFKVSRLEGFVSNREQSYEDPIEELLYAVFVVSSENATVAELAATLQADLSRLQAAASFACRLGWAVKVIDPSSILQDSSLPGYACNILSDDEDGSHVSVSSASMSTEGNPGSQDGIGAEKYRGGPALIALVVDANITSYLMMGSISPGLKSHAVTLYEAGKLGDASIADLCKDLTTLEGRKFEGELQEFANHAYSLRCILECLRSGGVTTETVVEETQDKMDVQSTTTDDEAASLVNDINITEQSVYSETKDGAVPDEASVEMEQQGSPVDRDIHTDSVSGAPADDSVSLTYSDSGVSINEELKTDHNSSVEQNMKPSDSSNAEKSVLKRKRKYSVNILRCESLASLPPATLDRLFHRDYDIVVSVVPLPSSSVLPGPSGPIHFGPPSYSSMTPWMKLALYSAVGNGPVSVVLMKGQCLRLLPAPLAGCEKALIWSWDGAVVGGLGGKFEGNLVNGNILLHCLNSLLKHSAVLVLPLSKFDLDESGKIVTLDVPLPLMNSDGSIADIGKEMGLPAEESTKLNSLLTEISRKIELWAIGYIRLLKLHIERESDFFISDGDEYEWVPLSLEFGVPLFSPKLCSNICERVVASNLLQTDSLTEHNNAMYCLRKRLREICSDYQAAGPSAKILYNREHARESSRQLINYASGRWNPFLEPSTPISGSKSEHQRLNLYNRQRCGTEVLSFDGSILRSKDLVVCFLGRIVAFSENWEVVFSKHILTISVMFGCCLLILYDHNEFDSDVDLFRSYALTPVYEAPTLPVEESTSPVPTRAEPDDADGREVVLPGVNLIFDGAQLDPFDIGACLQARQPVSLIAEASTASASLQTNRV